MSRALIKVSLKKLYNNLYLSLLVPLTAFSVSWFITDENGDMRKNGVADYSDSNIDLTSLPKGHYAIRMMGEVHRFELS